jgi:hypothetical protein
VSNQVWVCGEVVIDLIPDGTERKAVVGGGPANTAKALSKLGISTQFIDGISNEPNPGGDGMVIFIGLAAPTKAPTLGPAQSP